MRRVPCPRPRSIPTAQFAGGAEMAARRVLGIVTGMATAMIMGLIMGLGIAHPVAADMIGHGGMVRTLSVSPDGSRVLTGSFDYTARLWDFSDQTEIGKLNEHNGPVNAVAFLAGGKQAITASDDRTVILWDLNPIRMVRRFEGHQHKIMGLGLSPDGAFAATGSWDRTVRIWDLANGAEVRVLKHPTPVNAVVYTPAGNLISGSHDGIIRIWNPATGAPDGKLTGHAMGITQLAVSPDGNKLLSVSIDGKIKLWDLTKRREMQSIEGHDGQVYTVAFSPDGKHALTAGRDGAVIHWDLTTAKPVRTIPAHDKMIWGVAFTPNGQFALSASSDEAVRVWHLATGDRIGIPEEGSAEPQPWLESDHPGARLFRKCAKCHSLSATGLSRSGPHFEGLFGRAAGTVDGYKYSDALKQAKFIWDDHTLAELFTKGPDIYLPGTKMPVQRIGKSESLASLIAYMRELTGATR